MEHGCQPHHPHFHGKFYQLTWSILLGKFLFILYRERPFCWKSQAQSFPECVVGHSFILWSLQKIKLWLVLAARSSETGGGQWGKPLFESRQLGAWHSVLPSLSLAPPLTLGTWIGGRNTCLCVPVNPYFSPPRSYAWTKSNLEPVVFFVPRLMTCIVKL